MRLLRQVHLPSWSCRAAPFFLISRRAPALPRELLSTPSLPPCKAKKPGETFSKCFRSKLVQQPPGAAERPGPISW